jgi:type I restriction enzyme S subunit
MSVKEVKLSTLLTQIKDKINIDASTTYRLVTISKTGEIKVREEVLGSLIKNSSAFRIKSGTFIYSRLAIQSGAFGIVPQELNNAIVTSEMPSFEISEKVLPEFLLNSLKLPFFKFQMEQLTKGIGRTRVKEKAFLTFKVQVPDLKSQSKTLEKIKTATALHNKLNIEISLQESLLFKLRQTIFNEALEGKISCDWRSKNEGLETSSDLLKKIKLDRENVPKKKTARKDKTLNPIVDTEIPFDIPKTWTWCRFGEYSVFERGRFSARPRNDPSYFGGDIPFIQIGSLSPIGHVINSYRQTLNERGLKVSKLFPKGSVIIAIVGGTIGNLGVLGNAMCFPDSIVGVKPNELNYSGFVLLLLRAHQKLIKELSYQMAGQPNIKLPNLNNLLIALPPLNEQKVIVENVNHLLEVCNELEDEIKTSSANAQMLMQAVLKEAFEGKKEEVEV